MQVQQLMTRIVQTCSAQDTLNRAMQLMWEHDCGCVPVVDSDSRVVGMITDRDIAVAAYIKGKKLTDIGVGSVMSHALQTCAPSDPVATAEERMRKYSVRRIPVTDASGKLLGLITLNDIALESARERGQRRPQVAATEVASTLAAVCRHRGPESLTIAAE
jgi:CBS domain-containing protein